ncbi:AAA family ATPase [Actinoplanes sp. CA-054009]
MPLLSPRDPLPNRPSRILVAGTSGSGKSTVARRIAEVLAVPYLEIDSLQHGPGWEPRPTFVQDVHRFTAGPAWVIEWQYQDVRDHLVDRADLMLWLDLPRRRVMRQVITRTVRRARRGEELWNGNREPPLRSFFTDPDHIIRWAWKTHPRTEKTVTEAAARRPDLPIVRLRTHREASRFVTTHLPGRPAR